MVKNSNVIHEWNENGKIEKKFLPEVIKEKMSSSYVLVLSKSSREKKISEFNVETCDMDEQFVPNENYKEPSPRIKYAMKKYQDYYLDWNWVDWPKGPKVSKMDEMFEKWAGGRKEVYRWVEITPHTPSVFVTVCPPWKNKLPMKNCVASIRALHSGIRKYLDTCMNGAGYSDWSYVVECGSTGRHLHAHIWAKITPDMEKSMLRNGPEGKNSHIRKGKHISTLKAKIEEACPQGGLGGKWGATSVTSTICRTEEIEKDKQNYLVEELKPEDHKNAEIDKECLKHYFVKKNKFET